ncbi:MAG TPA: hypothetical protein VN673_04650, partial [Clostridia bacterium]|nr:hypothetical protein [Clostridia bacterium]
TFASGPAAAANTPLKTPTAASVPLLTPGLVPNYQTNNAELIAILMALEQHRDGRATVNKDHVKNPKRTAFLNASSASDNSSPGVGRDSVYRDPWGNPYIITIDTNNDGKARDALYRRRAVSDDENETNPKLGLYGLGSESGVGDDFELNAPVMVWSLGPDGMYDPNKRANDGANKDNVLLWKQ